MKLSRELIEKGNSWIDSFLLTEENSEFVQLILNPQKPAKAIAHFRRFKSPLDKTGNIVKVEYERLSLRKLIVSFPYKTSEEFFDGALEYINRAIAFEHGEAYTLSLDDVNIARCVYHPFQSSIAIREDHPFWYDACQIYAKDNM